MEIRASSQVTKCDVSRFLIIVKRKIIVSQNNKIQLKVASSSHCIYTFHPGNRGKDTNILHILFSPASVRCRETGSSVPLCRTQAFSLFMLSEEKHASTFGLSCDFASLRLQFPASSGRRTEKIINDTRNESLNKID